MARLSRPDRLVDFAHPLAPGSPVWREGLS